MQLRDIEEILTDKKSKKRIIYLFRAYWNTVANDKKATQLWNMTLMLRFCSKMNTTMKFSGIRKKFIIVERAFK